MVELALYREVKLVREEYPVHELENRATHCPDTASLYCTGSTDSDAYMPYADGLLFTSDAGAALGQLAMGAPVHASDDAAKSTARSDTKDPAPKAAGLYCPGWHVLQLEPLPLEMEPAPHDAHPDWFVSAN